MSARMLAAFLSIIVFNLFFVCASLLIGYQGSRTRWNQMISQEARVTVDTLLLNIINKDGDLSSYNCARGLADARERLLGVAQIEIYSPGGELLISWVNRNLDHYKPQDPDFDSAEAYVYNGEIKGYFTLRATSFRYFDFNRLFVSRMIHTALIGMLFSMGLSLYLAFRIASVFVKETRNTARNLINLSKGSRDIQVIPAVTTEISTINSAALSLQDHLISEENMRIRWYENIAHDLRTPITALKSQFIAVRDGILPITPDRWDTILGELGNLELLVKDFSFLSKIEATDYKPDRQTVSSIAIMDYLAGSLSDRACEKDITLVWDFQNFTFNCDFSLLTTAFNHLIRNAIQHSPEESDIQISLELESGIGVFRVINCGHIAENHINRVFDPLYKTDTSRNRSGTGLGLTISHRISTILGAEMHVENLENDRICFEIVLLACSSTVSA